MAAVARVAVVGVDCLTPQLLFDRYLDDLPVVRGLMAAGPWGPLRSTVPPITIPAWLCMATSQDPGQLGVYGFRNRVDHSYREMAVADASWLRAPSLWQLLSRRRRRSLVVGVPLTYPPRPIVGDLVCGVPLPSDAETTTAPASLRAELDALAGPGGYRFDVSDFRHRAPAELATELAALRDQRFAVVEQLARQRRWDLLFMVDMSVDRLHHAFWHHAHPDHPLHQPDSPFAGLLRQFYIELDACLGRLITSLGEDTAVLVVSDHGAKSMQGSVRFNEWLIGEGLLTLRQRPAQLERLRLDDIDWAHTRAWADGGYYARVFVNLAGREPQGVVTDGPGFVAELQRRLEAMPGPDGAPLGNRVFVPERSYVDCRPVAPDLIVYPGDLDYRANATVFPEHARPEGAAALFTVDNDTGVDGANHAEDGVWLLRPAAGQTVHPGRHAASLYDIAPTVLSLLGEAVPQTMIGRPLEL